MKQFKRAAAAALAVLLVLLLLPAAGCASDDWEGEWNREGDATYTRAILTITDAGGGGFSFAMTLYNGEIVGQLTDMTARYNDASKQSARCSIPDTRCYIDFELDEYGGLNVIYGNELPNAEAYGYVETASPYTASLGIIESELFGFAATAFITGHYERGEVEYLNATLYAGGVLTREQDEVVQSLMPGSSYSRLLDCYQSCAVGDMNNSGKHDDEIGGFVYYGSNTVYDYAAIIIMYDDGTASIVVSMTDGSLVFYSNNGIYKDGSLTPLPIQKWMALYNAERAA